MGQCSAGSMLRVRIIILSLSLSLSLSFSHSAPPPLPSVRGGPNALSYNIVNNKTRYIVGRFVYKSAMEIEYATVLLMIAYINLNEGAVLVFMDMCLSN